LLNGLAAASSLFFVAAGLSLIFGVTRIVNFAHGSFFMAGIYIAYTVVERFAGSIGFWPCLALAAVAVGVLGALIEMILLRRIYKAPELFQLLATFALVLVIKDMPDKLEAFENGKPRRDIHHLSERSVFPLRSLIPVKMDGLIGAQGNVGFSSIVSSAIRLHDHRIHIGQAAAALAVMALKHQTQPRDLAWNRAHLEEIQQALCGGTEGIPMLLWPWRDLPADHAAFVAINRLSARGLIPAARDAVDFQPDALAAKEWRDEVLKRCTGYDFNLLVGDKLTRGEFANALWNAIKDQPAHAWKRQKPDDADGDGTADLDDALPFSADAHSWP
jgi:hypothetical protein